MKQSFFNLLLLIIAYFATAQNASAQWLSSNPISVHLNPANANKPVIIGNTTTPTLPLQRLEVRNGNILLEKTNAAAATGNIFLGGITYPDLKPGMRLSYFSGNNNAYIDVRNTNGTTPTTDGLIFRVDNNPNSTGTERMRISNNGNVGIGTVSTLHKFQVHNGTAMISGSNFAGGPMLLFSSNLTTHPSGQWGIEYEPNQKGLNFWRPFNAGQSGTGNYFMFLSDDDGAVSISTKNSPALVGTNNTSAYRLFVKGGILTDQLLVQTGWADYVFEKNYVLPTLAEVEKHIAEKGHLPNVPSEKEVVENGLNVGKMAATQQEKIEELFLYVIQLNKDVQKLRAENESFNQMLSPKNSSTDEK